MGRTWWEVRVLPLGALLVAFWEEGTELEQLGVYALDAELFVRGRYPWSVQTDAALFPPDKAAEQDAEPEAARSWGLAYALTGRQDL